MTEAIKIYVNAINRMNNFLYWSYDDIDKFKSDEDEEAFIRQHLLKIANERRWKSEARIARAALKEVSFLKMSNGT